MASITNPDACLCADGALISAAAGKPLPPGASLCLSLAARARGFETASQFNDAPGTSHGDVMALFVRRRPSGILAIRLASAAGIPLEAILSGKLAAVPSSGSSADPAPGGAS